MATPGPAQPLDRLPASATIEQWLSVSVLRVDVVHELAPMTTACYIAFDDVSLDCKERDLGELPLRLMQGARWRAENELSEDRMVAHYFGNYKHVTKLHQ